MHFFPLFVAFPFIFSDFSYPNITFDVIKLCKKENHSIFVQENTSVALTLTLHEPGLNCSIQIFSNSPVLNFHFSFLNLPFDNSSLTCLASVMVSDFASFGTHLGNKVSRPLCRASDLPKNGITTTSPAFLIVANQCPVTECNYTSGNFNFELAITTHFDNDETSEKLYYIIGGVLAFLCLIIIFTICWFKRRIFYPRIFLPTNLVGVEPIDDNIDVFDPTADRYLNPLRDYLAQPSYRAVVPSDSQVRARGRPSNEPRQQSNILNQPRQHPNVPTEPLILDDIGIFDMEMDD